jgi:hypothetical protein
VNSEPLFDPPEGVLAPNKIDPCMSPCISVQSGGLAMPIAPEAVWDLNVSAKAKLTLLAIISTESPSIPELANMTGQSVRTVQYAIKELEAVPGIKVAERRDQNRGLISNSYMLLDQSEGGAPVAPGAEPAPPPGFPCIYVSPTTSLLPTTKKETDTQLHIPDTPQPSEQSEPLRGSLGIPGSQDGLDSSPTTPNNPHRPASPEGARNGRKPNTPTATRKPGTSLWEFCDQTDQLVAHFEQPVVERQKADYAKRGWTWRGTNLDERREAWREAAIKLLEHHSFTEVVETIDYVFGPWDGHLPSSVTARDGRSLKVDKNGRSLTHDDLKVTRLQLIQQGYESIREHMANPDMAVEPEHHAAAGPKPVTRKPVQQWQVDELMADFTEFRASVGDRDITEFRVNNWTKTFEVRLRQYPFEDIKAVIAAIRGMPQYIDQDRYRNPYAIFRDTREWKILQGHLQTYELIKAKKAAQPQVVPPPKAHDEKYDDEWRPTPRRMTADRVRSSDFSSRESIERRRTRYAAGSLTGDIGPATGDAKMHSIRDLLGRDLEDMGGE